MSGLSSGRHPLDNFGSSQLQMNHNFPGSSGHLPNGTSNPDFHDFGGHLDQKSGPGGRLGGLQLGSNSGLYGEDFEASLRALLPNANVRFDVQQQQQQQQHQHQHQGGFHHQQQHQQRGLGGGSEMNHRNPPSLPSFGMRNHGGGDDMQRMRAAHNNRCKKICAITFLSKFENSERRS